jgi:hypothetical protein
LSQAKKAVKYSDGKELSPAYFELVSPDCPTSKHVVISIGGMFTKNLTEKWQDWLQNHTCSPIYAYKWSTKSEMPTWKSFIPSLGALIGIRSLFSKAFLAIQAVKIPLATRKQFINMMKLADDYGKLLAHLLMLQFPFVNQSVSLIGFALGAQVIYSCLEELEKNGADNIIHNIYMIKGVVAAKKPNTWARILKVVRGKIYHYYAPGDRTLYIAKTLTLTKPIGMIPLLEVKSKEELTSKEADKDKRFKKLTKDLRIINIDAYDLPEKAKNEKTEFRQMLKACDF